MDCGKREDFKCQVCEEDACGAQMEHRWGEDFLSWVDRVPWNRYKEALDADGDVPEDEGKRWYSDGRFSFVR